MNEDLIEQDRFCGGDRDIVSADPTKQQSSADNPPHHERLFPTLLAGSGGDGTAIRFWEPDSRVGTANLKVAFGGLAIAAAAAALFHSIIVALYVFGTVLPLAIAGALQVLWPSRIAADSRGIAFTSWRGPRAAYWNEIGRVRYVPNAAFPLLVLYGTRRLFVCLAGYSPDERREIERTVRSRLRPRIGRSGARRRL